MENTLIQYISSDVFKYIFSDYYYYCDACNKKENNLININGMNVCNKCVIQITSSISKYSKIVEYMNNVFKSELPYFCHKYEIPKISHRCYCIDHDEQAMDREVYAEEMSAYNKNPLTCLFPSFIKKPVRPVRKLGYSRNCEDERNSIVESIKDDLFLTSMIIQKHISNSMSKKLKKMDNSNIFIKIKNYEMIRHMKELYKRKYPRPNFLYKNCFEDGSTYYDIKRNLYKHLYYVQFLLSDSKNFELLKTRIEFLIELDEELYLYS